MGKLNLRVLLLPVAVIYVKQTMKNYENIVHKTKTLQTLIARKRCGHTECLFAVKFEASYVYDTKVFVCIHWNSF